MSKEALKQRILFACRFFFIGLMLQFFVQTFVTFQLEWTGSFRSAFWMWKEVILVLGASLVAFALRKDSQARKQWISHPIAVFFLLFCFTGALFFFLAWGLQKVGLMNFVLTIKYDLLPFFIFWLGVSIVILFFTEKEKNLIHNYHRIIHYVLYWGLFWRGLVFLMPNALRLVGYDPYSREGTINARPPAAYYTLIKPFLEGSMVRNQFLFERPTSFWFWLIAFFPFFALGFLRKKSIKKQIIYTIVFALLVLSTRSRAAIAMFVVEFFIVALLLHWKKLKKQFWWVIFFLLIGTGIIGVFGQKLLTREHSTTGHLKLLQEGWGLAKQDLWKWRGAGYAGPASHQICYQALEQQEENLRCEQISTINTRYEITTYGFNPENQFLQILLEYGSFGLLFWISMLGRMLWQTYQIWRRSQHHLKNETHKLIYFSVIGCWIGLLGLCGEGMLLHSFSDRMVVYPFFLLYGICFGLAVQTLPKASQGRY